MYQSILFEGTGNASVEAALIMPLVLALISGLVMLTVTAYKHYNDLSENMDIPFDRRPQVVIDNTELAEEALFKAKNIWDYITGDAE